MENNAQNTGYHPERNTQPHSILSIPSSGKLGLRVFSVQESGCAEGCTVDCTVGARKML